jgi:ComF family protein
MLSADQMLLPRHCIQCGLWLTEQEYWRMGCAVCEKKWPDLRGNPGELLMQERCMMHRMWTGFRLRENAALEGQIRALKYQGRRRLGQHWGRWVASSSKAPKSPGNITVLVPVPLHWKRNWKRGYNQAEWIAKGVSKEWNLAVYPKALKRQTHGQSLTSLSRKRRHDLTVSAYTLGSKCPPHGAQIVLVDDVMTTGSTFRACAAVLESANHQVLGALTLALA